MISWANKKNQTPEKEARSPTGKKPHMLSKPKPGHTFQKKSPQ
jgi:hypothetical protein